MLYHYYQPTFLEEAYSRFLLQTEFQIITDSSTGVIFRLTGRQAVPFFCRSGIDRSVLRHMWSVVDPQVDGYLSTTTQFDTMLRLTALAQHGPLLPALLFAQTTSHVVAAPEDILRHCLLQTASMMLPLPFFQGIVIPSTMELQRMYQRAQGFQSPMPDAFAPTVPPPPNQMTPQLPALISTIPDPFATPAMTHATPTSEVVVLPTSLELTTIDDAFRGLVQVEDKPLPSLFQEPEAVQDETLNKVDDDEFGDFVDSASNQGSLGANSTQNYFMTTHPPDMSNVSATISAGDNSSFPTLDDNGDTMVTTPQVAFGTADSKDSTIRPGSHTEMNPDTFGNFKRNVPSNDFGSFDASPQRVATFDGTKDGGDEWNTSTIGSNAASSVLSISDAFGGMFEVPDRPLPSIKPADGNEVPSHVVEQQNQYIVDDSQAIPNDAESNVEVHAVFESSGGPTAPREEDATEPGANFSSHERIQNATFSSNIDEDETEFGDFAGTEVTETFPAEKSDLTLGETAIIPDACSPSTLNANGKINEFANHADTSLSGWDALDALSGVQDTPLPPLETFTATEDAAPKSDSTTPNGDLEQVEDDDFGEFVGDSDKMKTVQQSEAHTPPDTSDSPTAFDAFAVLGGNVSDVSVDEKSEDDIHPSLSLVPPYAVSQDTTPMDESDFGDFASGDPLDNEKTQSGAPEASLLDVTTLSTQCDPSRILSELKTGESRQPPAFQQVNAGWDAFDALGGNLSDKPLSPLAFSDGTYAKHDMKAFEPVDESTQAVALQEEKHEASPLSSDAVDDAASETDDFGDFSGVTSGSPGGIDEQSLAVDTTSSSGPQLSAALPAENSFAANHDVFSAHTGSSSDLFEHAAPVHTVAQLQSPSVDEAHNFAVEAEDFGDFSGFAANDRVSSSTTAGNAEALEQPAQVLDEFGNDSFGDFSGFESNQQISQSAPLPDLQASPPQEPATENSDNFGDFASFEAPVPEEELLKNPEYKNLVMLREFVEKASLRLPEAIRVQSNGGHVDFSNCFEANIGIEVPVSEARKKRIQRSIQIMVLLSSSHSKLASTYWQQAMTVARDEISLGSIVLGDAAGFTKSIQDAVRPKLETYVAGLGEFVRVCRSIVATVGDLLMLHPSSLFTIDTFSSSWCSLSLLKDYTQIENDWKTVEELAVKCGVERKKEFDLETISAMRLSGTLAAVADDQLCQFTLQPLTYDGVLLTKSPVVFHNGRHMACAANFVSHKCPSYAHSGF
ncbi:hypothetical protein FisN_9Lh259 [Fistulifera solaris]|uniref:EH domain-containing protein n=1 Tax=Fistulifera solaris TaxID=1519565 RepID=A0A1Z5KLE8_FISSO|nr:hypothetical protein FisN_9Lh259 [Fistulifera solaris]|eukprot:GAX26955.1 hypothetical protein FisN_9Lh259 [Fistulifera solaris]